MVHATYAGRQLFASYLQAQGQVFFNMRTCARCALDACWVLQRQRWSGMGGGKGGQCI